MNNNLEFKTFEDLILDKTKPPPPIIDDGVLLEKTLLIVTGKPKSGKSFLAFNLAVAIAKGKDFAGFKIQEQQKVMILSAEGGYFPNRERVKKMARKVDSKHLQNILYSNKAFLSLDIPGELKNLKKSIEEHKPNILIFDPLIRFHSSDENSSRYMSNVFAILRDLIENYSLSIIVVHHTGKDWSKGARGSSVIMAECDSSIEIRKGKKNHTFYFMSRHVETPEPLKLYFNPDSYWFESKGQNPIILYLHNNGSTTKTELVKHLSSQHSYSESYAYKLIKKCIDKGEIKDGKNLTLAV